MSRWIRRPNQQKAWGKQQKQTNTHLMQQNTKGKQKTTKTKLWWTLSGGGPKVLPWPAKLITYFLFSPCVFFNERCIGLFFVDFPMLVVGLASRGLCCYWVGVVSRVSILTVRRRIANYWLPSFTLRETRHVTASVGSFEGETWSSTATLSPNSIT